MILLLHSRLLRHPGRNESHWTTPVSRAGTAASITGINGAWMVRRKARNDIACSEALLPAPLENPGSLRLGSLRTHRVFISFACHSLRNRSVIDDSVIEKSSTLSLSRLYGGRKTSGRPTTADGTTSYSSLRNLSHRDSLDEKKLLKEKLRDKDADKETVKGKELSVALNTRNDGPGTFQPGQSIINQIGSPDHEGWMRKKGEHYNTWKVRYFIIKGPHLYVLRSDNKTVGF